MAPSGLNVTAQSAGVVVAACQLCAAAGPSPRPTGSASHCRLPRRWSFRSGLNATPFGAVGEARDLANLSEPAHRCINSHGVPRSWAGVDSLAMASETLRYPAERSHVGSAKGCSARLPCRRERGGPVWPPRSLRPWRWPSHRQRSCGAPALLRFLSATSLRPLASFSA